MKLRQPFIALFFVSLCGCQPSVDKSTETSLQELQEKYGGSANAYALHTTGMGLGTTEISPSSPLVILSEVEKVVITYHPPKQGIAPGGKVSVLIPPGSTLPQLLHKDSAGYVGITVSDKLPVEAEIIRAVFHRRPGDPKRDKAKGKLTKSYRVVEASLPDGLPRKGSLTFTWNKAKIDAFARRYNGDRLLFRVFADHDADGFAEEIQDSPTIPKIADVPHRLMLRCASTAMVGESVKLNILALDRHNNPAISYRGKIRFRSDQENMELPEPYVFTEQDKSSHTFHASFTKPGFYWIEAVDEENGFHALSNPVQIFDEDPGKRLYWGDLHVHTERSSDARSDAHTTSTYEGSYLIGRYRYALDFQANTEHHNLSDMDYDAAHWEEMKAITNAANDPGNFVTLVANEISNGLGDQNVYFPGDEAPFLLTEGENHPYDLWEILEQYECFAVPHHVAQSMRPWQWVNFNAEKMPVVEIFSNHGRAEFHGNHPHYSRHPAATLDGHTWVDQLNTGKKLGAIASSDDHWARPGTIGLTGVWASELTREGIYGEIKSRHCYASTASRVILYYTINGEEMGSFVHSHGDPEISWLAASPDIIEKAEVIKNGEVAFMTQPNSLLTEMNWTDREFSDSAYYYIRLTLSADANAEEYMQDRQQFIWSSPVWVSGH